MSVHPSTFELDVHFASGRPASAALEEHAATCEPCGAYLASLDVALAADSRPLTAPPPITRARPMRRSWLLPLAGGLALAAGALLLMRAARPGPGGEYVAIKGTPAVELLVKSEDRTKRWDDRSPVHPGDRIGIRVACEGMETVTVAAPAGSVWARLSETMCPPPDEPLPFTLVVDGESGDEPFAVVFSQRALDDAALVRAIESEERSGSVWVVKLVLPKVGAPR